MKRRRIAVVTSSVLVIILVIGMGMWMFSGKVIAKKSTEKGVLVNLDTWEVLDKVKVSFDGKSSYNSKISNKISEFKGVFSIEYTNSTRENLNIDNCTITFSQLYSSSDKRRIGSVFYFTSSDADIVGTIYINDDSIDQFVIDLCENYNTDKKDNIHTRIIVPGNSKENVQSVYNSILKDE